MKDKIIMWTYLCLSSALFCLCNWWLGSPGLPDAGTVWVPTLGFHSPLEDVMLETKVLFVTCREALCTFLFESRLSHWNYNSDVTKNNDRPSTQILWSLFTVSLDFQVHFKTKNVMIDILENTRKTFSWNFYSNY